jgi:galactarate dehydratase
VGHLDLKKPLFIQVHPQDNVKIVVNVEGVPEGEYIDAQLQTREFIPQGHKVSLVDLRAGDPVIRYNEVIGYAKKDLPKGSWLNETTIALPTAPALDALPDTFKTVERLAPLSGHTFLGYRNADGSVGTKNLLGVTSTTQCVEGILNIAVAKIKRELLPNYPNVDGVVPLNHNYGCGVAINAPDAVIPIRILRNLATNPNFGGELLVVGLGCEKLCPDRLFPNIKAENLIVLQEITGVEKMVEAIVNKARQSLERLNVRKREGCPASDLVVGVQCGGSDAFSGVTSNPAVGYAVDLLVRASATVLLSEDSEVRDGVHLLAARTINAQVRQKLIDEMTWYDRYLSVGGVDRDANPTPGNKKGGLANIVEKALGSIAKSGNSPIVDVLSPGEKATRKGLIYAATPASDFVCGTCQLASGITLQVFTTGRGTPYGLAMAPVLKVSSRTELADKWPDLIDVDAGEIATGAATIEEVGREIFELILQVASGNRQVWADRWGIENALCIFNPAPVT